MVTENPFQYESCPECGLLSFMHDEDKKQHVCTNEECQFTHYDDDHHHSESIWAKILKLLKLKR